MSAWISVQHKSDLQKQSAGAYFVNTFHTEPALFVKRNGRVFFSSKRAASLRYSK